MTRVTLEDVSKSFGTVRAVESLSCEICDGEFMVLVGPSGCGKTTLLRIILGALKADTGHIYMDSVMIDGLPIEKRNIGFVPQDFGLFPHLTVWENIGYGLRVRGSQDTMIRARVGEMLRMLELEELGERSPDQLSWGQRQRTALARALVIQPRLLLMDEPLSAVDWIAREEILRKVKGLHEELRITTIYVTHDVEEAIIWGNRIMLMNEGRLEECSEPDTLINKPKSEFARRFVRIYPINKVHRDRATLSERQSDR